MAAVHSPVHRQVTELAAEGLRPNRAEAARTQQPPTGQRSRSSQLTRREGCPRPRPRRRPLPDRRSRPGSRSRPCHPGIDRIVGRLAVRVDLLLGHLEVRAVDGDGHAFTRGMRGAAAGIVRGVGGAVQDRWALALIGRSPSPSQLNSSPAGIVRSRQLRTPAVIEQAALFSVQASPLGSVSTRSTPVAGASPVSLRDRDRVRGLLARVDLGRGGRLRDHEIRAQHLGAVRGLDLVMVGRIRPGFVQVLAAAVPVDRC